MLYRPATLHEGRPHGPAFVGAERNRRGSRPNILLPGLARRLFITSYAMPAALVLRRRPRPELPVEDGAWSAQR